MADYANILCGEVSPQKECLDLCKAYAAANCQHNDPSYNLCNTGSCITYCRKQINQIPQ
jgi:hypothetical protein